MTSGGMVSPLSDLPGKSLMMLALFVRPRIYVSRWFRTQVCLHVCMLCCLFSSHNKHSYNLVSPDSSLCVFFPTYHLKDDAPSNTNISCLKYAASSNIVYTFYCCFWACVATTIHTEDCHLRHNVQVCAVFNNNVQFCEATLQTDDIC